MIQWWIMNQIPKPSVQNNFWNTAHSSLRWEQHSKLKSLVFLWNHGAKLHLASVSIVHLEIRSMVKRVLQVKEWEEEEDEEGQLSRLRSGPRYEREFSPTWAATQLHQSSVHSEMRAGNLPTWPWWKTPVVHTRTGDHWWEHGRGKQYDSTATANIQQVYRVQLDSTAAKPSWYPSWCFVLSTSVWFSRW